MTAQLKNLLSEYAEQAHVYDVRAAALAAARKRRTGRRLAATAVALAVLAAGGIYALPGRFATSSPPGTPVPSPTSDTLDLPASIAPQPAAQKLPTGEGVGRGVRVYRYSADPDATSNLNAYLATTDGSHYRVDASYEYRLSPDGRWLVGSRGDTSWAGYTVLYDLSSGRSFTMAGKSITWSADSRWLAVDRVKDAERSEQPGLVAIIDTQELTGPPRYLNLRSLRGYRFMGVTADGDIALTRNTLDQAVRILVVDRLTGKPGREFGVDLRDSLTPRELSDLANQWGQDSNLGAGPGGVFTFTQDGLLYLQLLTTRAAGPGPAESGDVLVIDLAAQRVRERIKLPPSIRSKDHREYWLLRQVLPQGLLLTHFSTERRRYSVGYIASFDLYDPATGALRVVTDLSALSPPWR
ncbi:hypothetical protein [Luedemannella helvata]|uniref:Uncharacterized protein n=1 Tax=Luedemannella helvata TaxID=349315 RepID=A0ABN2K3C9_9ACTN